MERNGSALNMADDNFRGLYLLQSKPSGDRKHGCITRSRSATPSLTHYSAPSVVVYVTTESFEYNRHTATANHIEPAQNAAAQ